MSEMFQYRFEETRWPLVIIPSPRGTDPRLIDQDSFYAEFDRFRAKGERAFIVHDLRGVRLMDAGRRRRFVQYAGLHSTTARELIVGYAVLIDSRITTGIVTAVLWLLRPPCPMKVFSNPADGEAWLFSLDDEFYSRPKAS